MAIVAAAAIYQEDIEARRPKDEPGLKLLVKALNSIFFRSCIAGLPEIPLIGRLFLTSPYPKDSYSQPFGPLQEKASMDRYLGYSKHFLCYYMRVLPLGADNLIKQHAFSFTPVHLLWHFVAVLGINSETGQLQPAHHFTGILAGLIYTARAVVAEAAMPSQPLAIETIRQLITSITANTEDLL
ncbi:hypothetical protein EDB80DRAFT_758087 [Ilyonectria destructans]|nr:hypothetical protein EDB80DRAFT_758087 [Ilyonectria destructans]